MTETLTIERMSYGSDAIAHLASGKTVFVSGGVPGDVAEVEVVEDKARYAHARIVKLVKASPDRVASRADLPEVVAPWANMTYELQLASKQDNVAAALRRVEKANICSVDSVLLPIIASPHELNYRNKLEFAAQRDARGQIALGHRDSQGNFISIDSKSLALANKCIEKSPGALTGALRRVLGGDDLGFYRVGIRGNAAGTSIEVALWTTPGAFPRNFSSQVLKDATGATSIVRVLADAGSARRVKRVEVLDGDGFWRETIKCTVGGTANFTSKYFVSAPSFFQVNTLGAGILVDKVLEAGGDIEGACVADVYSGVGTFSIPLAKAGADVLAIELAGSSSRDFERNCKINDAYADMICDDAARSLPLLEDVDTLIVDPPKSGLDPKVIDTIADLKPSKVIYVSCDPQTFARDVERFASAGYALKSVQPVDMFPQTWHIECVSVFECR